MRCMRDQQPHRVEGIAGVEVHYVDHDQYPHELIQDSITDSFIINMLPGSMVVCTTLLAERPCALVDLASAGSHLTEMTRAKDYGAAILWDVGIAWTLVYISPCIQENGPIKRPENMGWRKSDWSCRGMVHGSILTQ